MSDPLLEPGRFPSRGVYTGVKPLPLEAVLSRAGLPAVEGEQESEELQENEASSSETPLLDRMSEELQKALEQWAMGSLKNLAQEVQEHLTDLLLSWKPDPKKSEEENLNEIREAVRRHNQVLTSQGGSLQMTKTLEEALLEALAKWLEQTAAQLLRLLGPGGSPDEVEQLLEKLFRQITGTSPSRGRAVARAAAMLQETAGRPSPQIERRTLSEEGVLYRRGEGGARLDRSYSGQALRTREQEIRSIKLDETQRPESKAAARSLKSETVSSRPPISLEWKTTEELRFAEKFADSISAQPVLPSAKELPFVSEERLGLELGLLWLKGEAAAREPGITHHTAALIRQATERRTESFFYEASYALQAAARAYPPGVCPNFWREDVFRVREELIRRYRLKKDPQRSLLETIAYTIELFQEKQGKEKYRTWLRYLPGRGLFLEQPGWEDIKQGWQGLCRSWERFLREMDIRNTPAFRAAVGLQSLWAMILPPKERPEEGKASLWTLGGWLGTAAAVAAVVYAVWFTGTFPVRAASIAAAGFFSCVAFLSFRKSRKSGED